MKKGVFVLFLMVLFSVVAMAQATQDTNSDDTEESRLAEGQDRLQLYAGYQITNYNFADYFSSKSRVNAPGWDVDGAWGLFKYISVVADVSSFRHTETNKSFKGDTTLKTTTFLVGPRVSKQFWLFTPFAEALIGIARTNLNHNYDSSSKTDIDLTYTGRSMAAGGGLDMNLTDRFAVRLGKVDYMINQTYFRSSALDLTMDKNIKHIRYSGGIVFRF